MNRAPQARFFNSRRRNALSFHHRALRRRVAKVTGPRLLCRDTVADFGDFSAQSPTVAGYSAAQWIGGGSPACPLVPSSRRRETGGSGVSVRACTGCAALAERVAALERDVHEMRAGAAAATV